GLTHPGASPGDSDRVRPALTLALDLPSPVDVVVGAIFSLRVLPRGLDDPPGLNQRRRFRKRESDAGRISLSRVAECVRPLEHRSCTLETRIIERSRVALCEVESADQRVGALVDG